MLLLSMLYNTPASAARPQIVSVVITDPSGAPIPNAWVRIPRTEGRRTVEPATGLWEASTVYRYDGSPLVFTRGLRLELTVSAPGYHTQRLSVAVRSRRNLLPVQLQPMAQPVLFTVHEDRDQLMGEWLGERGGTSP